MMADFRKEGYKIEIFFVFADIAVMEKRSKEREKKTGRQTDADHVSAFSVYYSTWSLI